MKDFYTISLQRADLMELESYLVNALREFFSFSSHSLYFPRPNSIIDTATWHAQERALHLPLTHNGTCLGVLMTRGVDGRKIKRLLPTIDALTRLCLDYLLSIKKSRIDELTGLARMPRLLERMQDNVELVRSHMNNSVKAENESYLHNACMALVVLRSPALDSLTSEFGYTFAHKALHEWTKTLQENLPAEVMAARSGENECTLLLHTATRASCVKTIESILEKTDTLNLTHSASKRSVRLHTIAGFALYPQDIDLSGIGLDMNEQSHHILQKARHAAHLILERNALLPKSQRSSPHNRYLAYANVLTQGGIVHEIYPLGQLLINLGRYSGAQEGQHFSVWGQKDEAWHCKGEAVLTQVNDLESVAEVLHLYDPAWGFISGDSVRLVARKTQQKTTENIEVNDQASDTNSHETEDLPFNDALLSHGDFLRQVTKLADKQSRFALALVRLHPKNYKEFSQKTVELEQILHIYQDAFSSHSPEDTDSATKSMAQEPTLMGRYGETSLMFFHPQNDIEQIEKAYENLVQCAAKEDITLTVGLAAYPFLQAHKSDILDHCQKALNLALLLKAPQVGSMGTLALNISADERYSRGDVFGAVEEYKLAILADAQNAMAWNSLGVCMAALAHYNEAQQYFNEALKLWKKLRPTHKDTQQNSDNATEENSTKVMVNSFSKHMTFSLDNEIAASLYNLGTVCQSLTEERAAIRHFKECIKVDNTHYFAHIRLGQLAEKDNKFTLARKYYNLAVELERNSEQTKTGIAFRSLAGIALKQENDTEARELLHETLLVNPQDALALNMLAKIYLTAGEDPAMSEILARKSVNLRPKYVSAWEILAKSLRLLGREDEALAAEERATSLRTL